MATPTQLAPAIVPSWPLPPLPCHAVAVQVEAFAGALREPSLRNGGGELLRLRQPRGGAPPPGRGAELHGGDGVGQGPGAVAERPEAEASDAGARSGDGLGEEAALLPGAGGVRVRRVLTEP